MGQIPHSTERISSLSHIIIFCNVTDWVTQWTTHLGERGGRVFGAGEQVLWGPGRRGRSQHLASHLHQELPRRHQSGRSVASVPQQGQYSYLCHRGYVSNDNNHNNLRLIVVKTNRSSLHAIYNIYHINDTTHRLSRRTTTIGLAQSVGNGPPSQGPPSQKNGLCTVEYPKSGA